METEQGMGRDMKRERGLPVHGGGGGVGCSTQAIARQVYLCSIYSHVLTDGHFYSGKGGRETGVAP